jgi:beta-lactamase regulating signal transducer with metallopeptidase domain
LSTVAPTTSTVAPVSTGASGAVNIAAVATSTSTTVAAQKSATSASMPTTGSSTTSIVMWSCLILAAGVVLQLRVRHILRAQ